VQFDTRRPSRALCGQPALFIVEWLAAAPDQTDDKLTPNSGFMDCFAQGAGGDSTSNSPTASSSGSDSGRNGGGSDSGGFFGGPTG
jgi:hypothetical protein